MWQLGCVGSSYVVAKGLCVAAWVRNCSLIIYFGDIYFPTISFSLLIYDFNDQVEDM